MWWFAPTAGRWAQEGTAPPKAARTRSRRSTPAPARPHTPVQQGLFSDHAEEGTEEHTP